MDLLRAQFDKLLLAALICFFCGVLIYLARLADPVAAPALAWTEKSIDFLTGALLGIVTGRAISKPSGA